ncbi:MAG: hypothetical protein IKQ69_02245 [Oscillospiraceae bacterium]|nr:hypothetical protein [Oscillospiraceae bacterium]MBR4579095.1 hypothetical protein [Oscillospiraceae bacterium]MBR6207797.1 hypothetical protein [Oscillospiraceae bacterium]
MKRSWEDLYGEVPASFETRMRDTLASLPAAEPVDIRRFRFRPSALIAAVLMVMLLTGAAFATDLFGLKSLIVTDPYAQISPTASPAASDLIALQGFPESPEFKANSEWMDALAAARKAPDPVWTAEYPYSLYSVSSPALQARLDEITARYGLKLHSTVRDFDSEEELYALLGCEDSFFSNCAAISGYVYEDGSFHGDGTSVAGICYEYQFGRYGKGSFSEVTLHVGNPNDYEEWLYTTKEGVTVQLSLGPDRCVLMADLPSSFVAVNLLGGTRGDGLYMPDPVTRQGLETFAELFNFSALG